MKWKPDLTTVLLAIVLVFTGYDAWNSRELHAGINQVLEQSKRLRAMIAETITNAGNTRTVTITTSTGDTGDPDEDWTTVQSRHDSRVASWLEDH